MALKTNSTDHKLESLFQYFLKKVLFPIKLQLFTLWQKNYAS